MRLNEIAGPAGQLLPIVPRHVLGGSRFVAPSDKVNVALIGAGGQGRTSARALFEEPNCQIVALADPADEWDMSNWYFGGKAGRNPVRAEIEKHYAERTPNFRCAVYEDFRVMLEKERAIDAVLIATPDHLHAYASILAMSKSTSQAEHLKDMLVGNIIAVSWAEVLKTALLYGIIGVFHYVFRHKFLAMRKAAQDQPIETVGRELREMMTFLKKKKEVGVPVG